MIFILPSLALRLTVDTSNNDKYSLEPYYLIFIDENGEIKLDFSNAKIILDFMKKMSLGNDTPNEDLFDNFRVETKNQKYMEYYTDGLNTAIESIIGKKEEKGISRDFTPMFPLVSQISFHQFH